MHPAPPIAGILTLTAITPAPSAAAELADSQAVHRRVQSVFDGLDLTGGRLLWAMPTPQLLLIQAPCAPSTVLTAIGWAARQHTRDYQLGGMQAGELVGFSLIANPTIATSPPTTDGAPRPRGTRRPIPPGPGRDAWAHRKLADALTIHTLHSRPLPTAGGNRRGGRVTHNRHLFTGTALVTDPDALRQLVTSGVGPGKGYGCGLLLITPQAAA